MKKRVFSLILALALCLGLVPAATAAETTEGYTITEFLPMGRYDQIEPFVDGLAAVGIKIGEGVNRDPICKWGFIDEQGNEVVPCKYTNSEAPVFVDGVACVEVDGEYGYIDKTGKEIVPIGQGAYPWLGTPSEGLIPIRKQTGTRAYDGEPIYRWGYVDMTGKLVIPYQYERVESFSEGLAAVEGENWRYGFINTKGETVIPCQYIVAQDFSEGLAAVCYENADRQYAWGYIDKTGKVVVSNKYAAGYPTYSRYDEEASPFTDGLAMVSRDYKWGFIDKTGKEVVPIQYKEARPFSEGVAAVRGETGELDHWNDPVLKWCFVDKTGKEITPRKYYKVEDLSDGTAVVWETEYNWGIVDKTGREIVTPGKYKSLDSNYYGISSAFHDGLMPVENAQGKWGFIDKTGREVIPCKYAKVKEFSEGLAAVAQPTGTMGYRTVYKWGFIDTAGKEVIPLQFGAAENFSEGYARVGKVEAMYDNPTDKLFFDDPTYTMWGLIDATGKQVIPCQYRSMEDLKHGFAKVEFAPGKSPWRYYSLVDVTGQEVVPLSKEYCLIDYLSGNLWRVCKGGKYDGEYAVLSITGGPGPVQTPTQDPTPTEEPQRGVLTYTQVVAPQYEDAQKFSEGLAAVKKDGKWGYIDEQGEVVVPFQYDVAYVFNEGYAVVGTIEHGATYNEDGYVEGENGEEGHWETFTVTYDACYLGFIDKQGSYKPFVYSYQDEDGNETASEARRNIEKVRTDTPWAYIFHNGYVSIYSERYDPYWGGTEMWSDVFDTTGRKVTTGHRAAYPINESVMINGNFYDNSQWYEDMATEDTFVPGGGKPSPFDDYNYDLRPFNQGLAPVCVAKYDDDWNLTWSGWGFVDKTGNWVIEPLDHQIIWIQDIESDYEIFGETGIALLGGEDGDWGGIDKTGKTVIPFRYDGLQAASEGLMGFKENGKWGFLNAGTLEVAIPAQFDQVTRFNNGYAVAATKATDGTMTAYLIDRKGKAIPGSDKLDRETYFRESDDYENLVSDPDEYVVIRENGKYGYGHIDYLPVLPEQGDMSSWAFEEVTASIQNDLVPVELQNLYGRDITRGEFCQMAAAILEAVNGQDIDDVVAAKTGKSLDAHIHAYPFGDTASRSVLACYALGIVTGRGDGGFDPYASITRQEAATMLSRLADVLSVSGGQAVSFADAASFPAWAAQNIAKVSALVDPTSGKAVMGGTGSGNFSPLQTYTREQAYTTALRLYHAAQGN